MHFTLTSTAKITYEPLNRMLVVEPFEGAVIDRQDYCEQFDSSLKLTNGNKVAVLIKTAPFLTITKEAKEESLSPAKLQYMICQAILANNMAANLVANFYIKYFKPGIPTRLFSNEQKARKWLKEKIALYEKNNQNLPS
ncbi:MAG TPA: hypothetical protein VK177_18000 [Flavobacteriales bacterium]|nr:hypothetical protein [Flavobacteriales bacterium]